MANVFKYLLYSASGVHKTNSTSHYSYPLSYARVYLIHQIIYVAINMQLQIHLKMSNIYHWHGSMHSSCSTNPLHIRDVIVICLCCASCSSGFHFDTCHVLLLSYDFPWPIDCPPWPCDLGGVLGGCRHRCMMFYWCKLLYKQCEQTGTRVANQWTGSRSGNELFCSIYFMQTLL